MKIDLEWKKQFTHWLKLRLHSTQRSEIKSNFLKMCKWLHKALFKISAIWEQHLTSICTVWLQLWAFRADNVKAELAVLSRMCAASIYGKEMTDSCSGNTDNKREEKRRCRGRKKRKGKGRRRRKGRKKKKPTAGTAQGALGPWLWVRRHHGNRRAAEKRWRR